jgi:curli biogenesis system outer membrane secretion channel CsgG
MILPIPIGIGFIPDATGRVLPGLRGMVTTTTASLLTSWDKFQVSEIATTGNALIQSLGSKPDSTGALIAVPKVEQTRGLQIVGSLTQADSTVEDKSLSLGVSSSQNSFGLSGGKTKSTIALDLYLINIEDGLRIIGSTSSALTVTNLSVGGNASLQIGAVGIELDAEVHKNEGPHWAARQLVELSVLTLLGEAAGVNYQGCLTGLPLTGRH